MTLTEIYRKAIVEGLTSAEASEKYGCLRISLLNVSTRCGLPKLKTEMYKKREVEMKALNDKELRTYYDALLLSCSDKCKVELEVALKEIERRYMTLE